MALFLFEAANVLMTRVPSMARTHFEIRRNQEVTRHSDICVNYCAAKSWPMNADGMNDNRESGLAISIASGIQWKESGPQDV
jgi:hypothetical protein